MSNEKVDSKYDKYLKSKIVEDIPSGFDVGKLNPMLFAWQREANSGNLFPARESNQ